MILWILQPQFVGNFVNSIIAMKLGVGLRWAEPKFMIIRLKFKLSDFEFRARHSHMNGTQTERSRNRYRVRKSFSQKWTE